MPRSYMLTSFAIVAFASSVFATDPPGVKNAPDVGTKLPLVLCDDFQ